MDEQPDEKRKLILTLGRVGMLVYRYFRPRCTKCTGNRIGYDPRVCLDCQSPWRDSDAGALVETVEGGGG